MQEVADSIMAPAHGHSITRIRMRAQWVKQLATLSSTTGFPHLTGGNRSRLRSHASLQGVAQLIIA
eukprot:5445286-Amphidinium_carterae.1